ncbi:protein FAM117B-like isoform X2 [Photinus pyralis]|uniref:Glucocorticoid-induced transcript 1 protein n=1 Tax=Photinus pyralis TaxID=7054 RepID=A0A1Y1KA56_PHOPY|nr:protein FAM117B-like isoform X2 [Photinus pyralis]
MSGQSSSPRVRKSSPNTIKQGPMKATIPIASVLKNPSSLKCISPAISPTSCWKTRISPDHPSGQRSPGSTVYKVKSKPFGECGLGSEIRRTASLDTIYLKGQWPRDSFYLYGNILQVNKATQTDDTDLSDSRKIHSIIEGNDEKLEKVIIRQRLQRNNKESNGKHNSSGGPMLTLPSAGSQTNTFYMSPTTPKASPINIPIKPLPKPTIRNSVEGLNQEIERLVLKSTGLSGSQYSDRNEEYDKFCQVTPEGHRAPLAELLKATRSVNTQTPAGDFVSSCPSSGGSQTSSPDQESSKFGTSPHINKFLAREPPDGCEKVHLKSLEDHRGLNVDQILRPTTFQLKPSLGSAFHLLQPNVHTSADSDVPLVPSQQD